VYAYNSKAEYKNVDDSFFFSSSSSFAHNALYYLK